MSSQVWNSGDKNGTTFKDRYDSKADGKMAFEEMNGVYHGGQYVQGKDSVLWTKLGDLVPTAIT